MSNWRLLIWHDVEILSNSDNSLWRLVGLVGIRSARIMFIPIKGYLPVINSGSRKFHHLSVMFPYYNLYLYRISNCHDRRAIHIKTSTYHQPTVFLWHCAYRCFWDIFVWKGCPQATYLGMCNSWTSRPELDVLRVCRDKHHSVGSCIDVCCSVEQTPCHKRD